MAGTSGIAKKLGGLLGLRAGQTVVVLGGPERVAGAIERLGRDPGDAAFEGLKVFRQLRPAPIESVVLFVERLVELEDRICAITERLHPDGQVWVAWRSRRAGDVSEDVVRRIGLTAGMVDARVCAIDRVWCGMRLVIRRENRDALAYRLGPPRRTRRARIAPSPVAREISGPGSGLATARARRRS